MDIAFDVVLLSCQIMLLLAFTRSIERLLLVIVDILVKSNIAAPEFHDLGGNNLLHHSVHRKKWKDIFERILVFHPNAIRTLNSNGFLPVHLAARDGTVEVMKQMLELYPESASMVTLTGHNLLHLAVCDKANATAVMEAKVRFLF